jgi:hypothetical protein
MTLRWDFLLQCSREVDEANSAPLLNAPTSLHTAYYLLEQPDADSHQVVRCLASRALYCSIKICRTGIAGAVLITASGKQPEKLLGIATRWDILHLP